MTFPKPRANVRGTLVEHVPCEMVTFDLGTSPPPKQYRLYDALPGPATANANTNPLIFGMAFQVLTSGCSLVGYSPWCCNNGQSVSSVPFALWRLTGPSAGTLITAASITGGALTTGQYNDTLLPASVPLVSNTPYLAQMGLSGGFSFTTGFWASTGVGYTGMTNGPLQGFSDQGASKPCPFSQPQCAFGTGTADPTAGIASTGNTSFNVFLDVIVATS